MPKDKKKISFLHFAYPPNIGGVEKIVYEHTHILADLGYDILVLTGSGKESDIRINLKKIKEFQSILRFNASLQKKILENKLIDEDFYSLAKTIEQKLEENLQDREVIIVHNMLTVYRNLPFIYAFWQYAKKHSEKKYIIWVHDHMYIGEGNIQKKEKVLTDLDDKLLSNSIPNATYVAISKEFAKILTQVMDIPKDNLKVIPDGINIKNFLEIDQEIWRIVKKYRLLDRFPLILSPVNILERKNLEYSLEIIAELKKEHPDIYFLISGQVSSHRKTQDYFVFLKEKIGHLGLQSNVLFLKDELKRGLNESEIHDLYQLSDIVFYFSKSENFGLPILEASLTKTPIFTSNLKVFHEIGEDKINIINCQSKPFQESALVVKDYLANNKIIKLNSLARQKYHLKAIIEKRLIPLIEKK